MRVGIIGTGAISRKQAEAHRNIGFQVSVCTDINPAAGEKFARTETGAKFVASYGELCRHPEVDFVDVCTLPNFRLQAVEACAAAGKHIVVQKPMATDLGVAREMISHASICTLPNFRLQAVEACAAAGKHLVDQAHGDRPERCAGDDRGRA